MNNQLLYNGYRGSAKFSFEDNVFHGKIESITDLVTFEAQSETQLRLEFEAAVENYLAFLVEVRILPLQQ